MLVSRAYVLFLVLTLPERVVCMAVFAMSCTLKLLTEKSMKFIFAWTTELLGFGLDLLLIWKKVQLTKMKILYPDQSSKLLILPQITH